MKMTQEELIQLKRRIEAAKTKASQLEGQKELLKTQLRDQYNCSSIKEAKQLLVDMEKEIADIDEAIATGVEQLKEVYELDHID